MAEHKIKLRDSDYDLARDLTSTGWRLKDVARALGMCEKTLLRRRKVDERLADAIEEGRGSEFQSLVASLFRRALDPASKSGAASAMILLKSRHGLREYGGPVEGEGSRINIVLNIPGPLTPEQYDQLVSHHPETLTARQTPPALPAAGGGSEGRGDAGERLERS